MLADGESLLADGEWLAATLAGARDDVRACHRRLAEPVARVRLAELGAQPDQLDAAAASVQPAITGRRDDPDTDALVLAVHRLARLNSAADTVRALPDAVAPALAADLPAARPLASLSGTLFAGRDQRASAADAFERVSSAVSWASAGHVRERVDVVRRVASEASNPEVAWRWCDAERADFQALLADAAGIEPSHAGLAGLMPTPILDAVGAVALAGSQLRTPLRHYQRFGAAFLVERKRAIVGDDSGLGKTVQALAALAHLWEQGARHFLVLCPAEQVADWARAVGRHTELEASRLEGPGAEANRRRWATRGGLAIAAFDAVDLDAVGDTPIDALVVDDAHALGSPGQSRAIRVAALAQRCEHVWFLTGTPFEHRVGAFGALASALGGPVGPDDLADLADPATAGRSTPPTPAAVARFRARVAPVYLRREAPDVHTELPPLEQIDAWTGFAGADGRAYADAVALGNFSAMRRAGFASADPREAGKIARLSELVGEARADGATVVVFSAFLSVLHTIADALHALEPGVGVLGPLTTSVPEPERQPLADRLAEPGGDVLLVHLQQGGAEVRIPGAPRVVLCEPQVVPALELGAVDSCSREPGGTTLVYRLLTEDSVDERMLEALDPHGVLAAHIASPGAPVPPPVSEVVLAQRIIPAERARLGVTSR